MLNGVLWILRSGARWKDLPGCFPPYQTYHRRYQSRVEGGALRDILEVLAEDLRERGQIDLSECRIDGTFIVAKKGQGKAQNPRWPRAASLPPPAEGRTAFRLAAKLPTHPHPSRA